MYEVLFLIIIGAVIGWITNVLAIKMLFRPIKPIRIPVFNITIQGLIPKRRHDIAISIGEVVEKELISIHEIFDRLVTEENKKEVIIIIKEKLLRVIDYKIPAIIPYSIKNKIIDYFGEQINKDAMSILDSSIDGIISNTVYKVKIGEMVKEKIEDIELMNMEKIIISLVHRELKYIEMLGGLLGGIIGFLQAVVMKLI
ncbi:MAG TPA: DUF445 family protein [Bacillota bacterium]|nr:DUF445 family protein [Bacillota bacterium]HOR86826.1 DUF445 family protein [Bacillota bacterium]HPL54488.1 DUF445 family protein [Bacillota bacterium]